MNLINDYKAIRLDIRNEENETIRKQVLRFGSGDTLTVKVSQRLDLTLESYERITNSIQLALANKIDFLIVPEGIELQILKRE